MKHMNSKDKWLISLDLDGTTLLDPELWIDGNPAVNDKNIRIIRKLEELGHVVVINTGRAFFRAERIYNLLGTKNYIITSAGARIHNPMDSSFVEIYNPIDLDKTIDMVNEPYIKDSIKESFFEYRDHNLSYSVIDNGLLEYMVEHRNVKQTDTYIPIEAPKSIIITLDVSREELDSIIDKLNDKYKDNFIVSPYKPQLGVTAFEINNKAFDKGDAILALADRLDIDHKHTLTIGDSINDLYALNKVEESVAMKNASVDVLTQAKHITKYNNNEGGVGEFLKEFFGVEND